MMISGLTALIRAPRVPQRTAPNITRGEFPRSTSLSAPDPRLQLGGIAIPLNRDVGQSSFDFAKVVRA